MWHKEEDWGLICADLSLFLCMSWTGATRRVIPVASPAASAPWVHAANNVQSTSASGCVTAVLISITWDVVLGTSLSELLLISLLPQSCFLHLFAASLISHLAVVYCSRLGARCKSTANSAVMKVSEKDHLDKIDQSRFSKTLCLLHFQLSKMFLVVNVHDALWYYSWKHLICKDQERS